MRLSEGAIYSVSSRASTQKCEAFKSAASATQSKRVSFSRTFTRSLSAQNLHSNDAFDKAVKKKIWKITGTGLGVWVKSILNRFQYAKWRPRDTEKLTGTERSVLEEELSWNFNTMRLGKTEMKQGIWAMMTYIMMHRLWTRGERTTDRDLVNRKQDGMRDDSNFCLVESNTTDEAWC